MEIRDATSSRDILTQMQCVSNTLVTYRVRQGIWLSHMRRCAAPTSLTTTLTTAALTWT